MKRQLFLLLALLGWALPSLGQATFRLDGFSDRYYGKAYFSDTSEVISAGWVAVYDKQSDEELIRVHADELSHYPHEGELEANIAEVPYGMYSVLLHEDYNFDGKKDFALMDGQHSCYNGPSFKIYLAGDQGFEYSSAFTRLAQEYCGMFTVDTEDSTLVTMAKDGCCWHQFCTWAVKDNEPRLIRTVTADDTGEPISTTTVEEWDGEKMVKSVSSTLDLNDESVQKVFAFHIGSQGKDMALYNVGDRLLYYMLTDSAGNVELAYPAEIVYNARDFTYNAARNTLRFQNGEAYYTILGDPAKPGIEIIIHGKTYHWEGDPTTCQGSLRRLMQTDLGNVVKR